jgi:hypothetical protein
LTGCRDADFRAFRAFFRTFRMVPSSTPAACDVSPDLLIPLLMLREPPASNRKVARATGVHHNTVADARTGAQNGKNFQNAQPLERALAVVRDALCGDFAPSQYAHAY